MFSTQPIEGRFDLWDRPTSEAIEIPMPTYKAKLMGQKTICAGTTAFYFEKPKDFQFEAGQFGNLTLLTSPGSDPSGYTRALSIASAPHERSLMMAMRLRTTDFKRTLNSLPLGTELLLEGPFGWMTLPRNSMRPAVLLAGGIGITPFRSLIWNAAELLSPRRILLFYSVRVPEEAAFLQELREMEQYNRRYKLICTVTQPDKARMSWQGETGRISIELLSKWIPDLTAPIYYIAGSPGMVTGVRNMLITSGISEDDVCAEEFAGYE
jgi:ferredoxin-NADP reductase